MPFAYIDPGSGSMLIQVLLAGLLAVPFFFRRVISDTWHRIRGDQAGAATEPTAPSATSTATATSEDDDSAR